MDVVMARWRWYALRPLSCLGLIGITIIALLASFLAAILGGRYKSFSRLTDEDWDLIQKVHLRGSCKVAKAAWEHFQKQGYGRIIKASSAAGIYGNFGQANYSAANLAVHGLTQTLAREGARKNIYCNSIAPIAASRMTETVFPPKLLAHLNPSFIVPVVAYLCHQSCEENGSLFELGAKRVVFTADSTFTPGSVSKQIAKIGDYTDAQYPTSIAEVDWVGLFGRGKVPQGQCRWWSLKLDKDLAEHMLICLESGAGAGSSSADTIVNELRALGAKAVANCDSVVDGDKVIETAMKAFGRVDIISTMLDISETRALPVNRALTPEQVASQWSKITDFEDGRATYLTNAGESLWEFKPTLKIVHFTVASSSVLIDFPLLPEVSFEQCEENLAKKY
ncbi:hypothetical protein HDU77_009925 [Chytriomyces hyalinus]|nr:hypothetical protein HDU77_009925 [Chytriomyces hyalinus]